MREKEKTHYYEESIDTRVALLELAISHLKKELKRIEEILDDLRGKK